MPVVLFAGRSVAEHHHGRNRLAALIVGNIEAVHTGQRFRAAHDPLQFFRRFLVRQLLHLPFALFFLDQLHRIFTGQLHQLRLVAALGRRYGNLSFRFGGQPLLQHRQFFFPRQAGNENLFRQENVIRIVVLFQKRRDHISFFFPLCRQHKILAADQLAAPDEEHLQAHVEIVSPVAHDVHVPAFQHSLLAFFQPVHRLQLIPVTGRLLKFVNLCGLLHALF